MPLRARVGRHASTGAQCQNWVEDQQIVTALLNLIPRNDGGAEAGIAGRVVGGIASDALCSAILTFQKKYFPAHQTGFVEPTGVAIAKLEELAARPSPAPAAAPTGPWGVFQSKSVPKALRAALQEDRHLNHVEVVEILRATMQDGRVTQNELADLKMISEKSNTIMPRSKTMLENFVSQAGKMIEKWPFDVSSVQRSYAVGRACDFMRKLGRGQWPNLDRDEVGIGIIIRVAYPGTLDQNQTNLCGPAALVFNVLRDRPGTYAAFACDMYDKGEGVLYKLPIKPKADLRHAAPSSSDIAPVDWLALASIRNSNDWVIHYDSTGGEFSGVTTPMELAYWFDQAGYTDVREDANFFRHQRDTDNMKEANRLLAAGYHVVLLIGSNMVDGHQTQSSDIRDDHWVVLQSEMKLENGEVTFHIYTWGDGYREVPLSGALTLDDFLMNYYGYVAAKPY